MTNLFDELKIKDITLRNRIAVSPMCQYSSNDGLANDWHIVHIGSRAVGGFGLIICEATSVSPEGRISPADAGIWSDEHIEPLTRINKFIHENGSVAGIQLAHAGRKASTAAPWERYKSKGTLKSEEGGWDNILGASPIPFNSLHATPKEMTIEDIKQVTQSFKEATVRSVEAGYKWLEIHAAHGYLLNTFLSPLANQRTDNYGGSFENRTRLLKEVISEIKSVWPEKYPLTVRISASDWAENGWTIEDSVKLSRTLKNDYEIDLIDCSSGGMVDYAKIKAEPNYQVGFAEQIKKETGILTGAVGLITEPEQADKIISNGQADLVFLAREALREPYWPIKAAQQLNYDFKNLIAKQYERSYF